MFPLAASNKFCSVGHDVAKFQSLPTWTKIRMCHLFGSKLAMNWAAMARYGLQLSQDVATEHMNLLETYLALYKPPGSKNEGLGAQCLGDRAQTPNNIIFPIKPFKKLPMHGPWRVKFTRCNIPNIPSHTSQRGSGMARARWHG